ncbi:MAG TPA: neutral/alkaline non-lysosomal ceramidase N-terminal domain-containing protein [Candidatus Hydrogenedentes bacterium]|nr:neutral/alkaline non-lysosomal ceramidase N-terminal domain-containing protein [Candidatus Hydrogenedentota bacterium]HOV72818.1 neutral/alkaline non-lysosomal ceramidase N-terminal domain-containing protein [Candidatus Hydrogenedentota bacterium]HPC16355.1 neutral/alkaline non-lysosomal ceramidase N-terminal domain-containing protein [Candidatus Hydrogenedentota bacterium]HRT20288.1 neutral/alkaline non-lysosomal ceramidase N-terminal domain-containing protein [Candidatus Hydrogenedentota ba
MHDMHGLMAGAWVAGCVLLAAPVTNQGVETTGWKAGVARADITPGEPVWMAGYASRTHEADGTLLTLFVKALAIEDASGRKALIVTSDTLGFPRDLAERVRGRLKASLGLEREQVVLCGSHTHSGPVLRDSLSAIYPLNGAHVEAIERYSVQFEDRVVECAAAAFDALAPARLSSANGVARFAVNRRNNREAEILDTHDLKGPVDHAVPVLRVDRADGGLLAVLFGYACHATTLDIYQWSGDYPGFAQAELEAAHPGATALFFAGCGADQNPLPRRTVALARQYGRELAAAVERVLEDPMTPIDGRLDLKQTEVELALAPAPSRDHWAELAAGSSWQAAAAKAFLADLDAGKSLPSSYVYPIHVWRLGGLTMVALGGEVVVDYAVAIKKELGRDVFVMGYCNDVMAYIPSERILKEGGYEGGSAQMAYGLPSPWAEGIESRILNAVYELAKSDPPVK